MEQISPRRHGYLLLQRSILPEKRYMKFFLLAFAFLFLVEVSSAQSKDYSKDVVSIDAIIAALYDVISGDPGANRDWDRFRNLFKPETRLLPTRKSPQGELTLQ